MHYSTILENFNSFSPYLIQPDFPTVANKNLTKNSESLYFSRLSALSCLLHTQEVPRFESVRVHHEKSTCICKCFFQRNKSLSGFVKCPAGVKYACGV